MPSISMGIPAAVLVRRKEVHQRRRHRREKTQTGNSRVNSQVAVDMVIPTRMT